MVGGASVGEHDLVQGALTALGMALDFWKIAMRPGKPLMVGRLGGMRVLGLPGNPVSALVCGIIFLKPLIRAMLGLPDRPPHRNRRARRRCRPTTSGRTMSAPALRTRGRRARRHALPRAGFLDARDARRTPTR